MSLEEGIKLFAAFGIGTIFSAVVSFISNNKNNFGGLEKEIYFNKRNIILEVLTKLNSYKARDIFQALEELKIVLATENKSLLGKSEQEIKDIGKKYYLEDGHIWNIINNFNYSTDNINLLKNYLWLLLEYEENKIKSSVIWNTEFIFSIICKVIPIVLAILLAIYVDTNQTMGIVYLFCIILVVLSEIMIFIFQLFDNPSVRIVKRLYSLFYVAPVVVIFFRILIWKSELFISFGMQLVLAFIILVLILYSYISTFSRIDNYSQSYINKIKKC
ncbi:hypothetical protein HO928_06170 [Streptococcus suis]|nr:hypothetical protein [Streptococcus suis]NQP19346.1 hypothetical protein [Streptococcus suis]